MAKCQKVQSKIGCLLRSLWATIICLFDNYLYNFAFAFRFYYEVGEKYIIHILLTNLWLPFLNEKSQRHGTSISPAISRMEIFSVCMCVCLRSRGHNFYLIVTKFDILVGLVKSEIMFEDGLCRSHRDTIQKLT